MELLMPSFDIPVERFRNCSIIIVCFILGIVILIINIIRQKRKNALDFEKQLLQTIAVIIGFIGAIILCISLTYSDVLYAFDHKSNNVEEIVVDIVDVEYSSLREYNVIDNEGYSYRFTNNNPELSNSGGIKKFLTEHFLGHRCEIEYYKNSKVVIRIAVID